MGAAAEKITLSEAEYLAAEDRAVTRSEYVAGEVFAMAGGSERHNRITLNIAFHLRAVTRRTVCRAFMSDMKLRIAEYRAYYYPDVMVVCDPKDEHPYYKTSPCFIAEVLSPSTAAIDRREKWLHYRAIPGLRHYLIVDAEKLDARLFSRIEGDRWTEQAIEGEDIVTLECGDIRIALSLDDIYEDTGLLPV